MAWGNPGRWPAASRERVTGVVIRTARSGGGTDPTLTPRVTRELVSSVVASGLASIVYTDAGDEFHYGDAILATGASARALPGTSPELGLHTLGDSADALALKARLNPGAKSRLSAEGSSVWKSLLQPPKRAHL